MVAKGVGGFSLHFYPVSVAHSTPELWLLRASSTTLMSMVDLSDPNGKQDTCHTMDPGGLQWKGVLCQYTTSPESWGASDL